MSKDKFQLRIEWVAPTGERFKSARKAELWCKLKEAKEKLPERIADIAQQIFDNVSDIQHLCVLLNYCEEHGKCLTSLEENAKPNSR